MSYKKIKKKKKTTKSLAGHWIDWIARQSMTEKTNGQSQIGKVSRQGRKGQPVTLNGHSERETCILLQIQLLKRRKTWDDDTSSKITL
ncbi:hypothetical protein MANES_13G101402v8 [Manihot esculenta]|uniref:Uncharacterized protein n=1 Tax=Manihot esculenta TaxID=3983 RepID=A0ACB7GL06_MANES|nr:hypothetical protein MANES_13G101402v8 [Manihot esculenta]